MRMKYECLPCLVNQTIRVAELTNAGHREELFRKIFEYLSHIGFDETNPEITGATFKLLKAHIGNNDPYRETRAYYNKLFLDMLDTFAQRIDGAENPFALALKYAIIGNIIDFNPIHNTTMQDIMRWFEDADRLSLTIDQTGKLEDRLQSAKSLLYIGDNCGEICLDMLLIQRIKRLNPDMEIFFGVRGEPVVNDSIEADAYFVGMDRYATIISNGDSSMGTVLSRCSDAFRRVYSSADVIIAKGQANYESLSEEREKNLFFLLVTKCEVIAKAVGVPVQSLVCVNGYGA